MLRSALLLTVLLAVLLSACSGIEDTVGPTANGDGTTTPTTSAKPAPTATPSATATDAPTGGALTIPAWDLTFTLPDTIPSGDVTLLDHTGDGDGFVDLRSATLEKALDTDACGGSGVEQGQFAQIARRDGESADAEGNVAVGGHVYHVEVFSHLAACYPDELVQRYLTEEVGVAIRESLTAS